jgi:hypothetical protein
MRGRAGFIAVAVVSAVVGAHSLNPREVYNEMYPVETLKRDAFHICNDADPTFVRAVKVDREACYDSMPQAIEVALGRTHPGGALAKAALLDPSRQAELLLQLAAIPPRQPITVRRTFANTDWTHALSAPCGENGARAAPAPGLPPPPGAGRAASLNTAILGNLPPLSSAKPMGGARPATSAEIPLARNAAPTITTVGNALAPTTAFDPLSSPDVGDSGPPAIVPIPPGGACGGA